MTDGLFGFGVVTTVIGLAGLADDVGDALILLGSGLGGVAIGIGGQRTFVRAQRPPPGKVLSGLALVWITLVLVGTGVYLLTGTIDRVDDAFVESAAGFSTTAATTLDPTGLSVPMQLWRAATQWIGGCIGVLAGVVAIPMALGRTVLTPRAGGGRRERLVPSQIVGRRRVFALYVGFTVIVGVAYLLTGLGTRDSVVHAFTTVSTGGFSSRTDSFASIGGGPRVVATVAMAVAGSSFFLLWWLARGRIRPLVRSMELHSYLAMIGVGTALVILDGETISVGDALFTVVSAASTTGHAVGDWTALDDAALAVLLVIVATGSMTGSAGGGLRVLRARVLVRYAARELRRQLDPHAVIVVKHGDEGVDERALERMTGYQISHLGLITIGAFALAAFDVDVLAAIWTSVSAVSTFGPGIGTGPFGSLEEFSAPARLALVPFMLAGRLSVLPLLLGVIWFARGQRHAERRVRRMVTKDRS
jgi:trk system potassium uptake protein TrkH